MPCSMKGNRMDDETNMAIVATGTLMAFVFVSVLVKTHKAKCKRSLGSMYKPIPKKPEPPETPHW